MKKGLFFLLLIISLSLLLGGCDNIEDASGESKITVQKYDKVPVGYKLPKEVNLKDVSDFKELKDGEQVVKKGDKEMFIYPKKSKADEKVKDKDLNVAISGATVDEKEECYFHISSSTPILEVGDFSNTKEWAYNGSGWNTETVSSNCPLIVLGDKIAVNEPVVSGVGLNKKTVYEQYVYYPQQFINTSIPINVSLDNGTIFVQEWSLNNTRYFIPNNEYSITVHFFGEYDPTLSYNYTEGLLSCYSFDTDASDDFSSHDGSVTGATHITTNQKIGGGAYSFDGADDYIQVSGLHSSPTTMSVCGWLNRSGYDSSGSTFFSAGDSVGFVAASGNTRSFYHYSGGWRNLVVSDLTLDNWVYVCVVVDPSSSSQKTYYDGVLDNSGTFGDAISYINTEFFIGKHGDGDSNVDWDGYIDEVMVWNIALNQTHITELYNSGTGVSCQDIIDSGTTANTAPSTPTNLTVNSTNDFNGTFSGTQTLQCSGSTDADNDTITYVIEKGNATTTEDLTNTTTIVTKDSDSGNDTITALGQNCGSECAVDAFDRNTGSKWIDLYATATWIIVELGTFPKQVGTYQICSANDAAARDPDDWTIEGSNDGSTWFVLDTVLNNGQFASRNTCYDFVMDGNQAAYKYYKMNITSNNGDPHTQISEINFYEQTGSGETYNYTIVGNHTNGSSYAWDLSGEEKGEVFESFRCRAIDIAGTNTYSSYYTLSDTSFEIGGGTPPADTCTYTSGNWEVDCSDNCVITENVDLGGNDITITGTGTFFARANITNYGTAYFEGTDASNRCVIYCEKGGCFQNG